MRIILILMLFFGSSAAADTVTVGFAGLTYHNLPMVEKDGMFMPRKLDKIGLFVVHPEISLSYKWSNGFTLNSSLVSDCYGNAAGYLGAGKTWTYGNHDLFAVMGLYVRENAPPTNMNGIELGRHQMLPMPWLGYSYSLPVTQKTSVNVQLSSNYFLNHATLGLRRNLP